MSLFVPYVMIVAHPSHHRTPMRISNQDAHFSHNYSGNMCHRVAPNSFQKQAGRNTTVQGINHERKEHLGLDLLNALARLASNHRLADWCQWAMAKMHVGDNIPVLVHLDLGHHHV